MEHNEAVQQKSAERYLLNELTPEARDAFEGHFFDCQECALDLRAAAAFMDEAKAQLPALAAAARPVAKRERRDWFAWARPAFTPAFAAPAFACLVLVIGYQNTVTLPGLKSVASQPRLLPLAALHTGTRGGAPIAIQATHAEGVALSIDLPRMDGYTDYTLDLFDPQGKRVWSRSAPAPSDSESEPLLLAIPGAGLTPGVYTVVMDGVGDKNAHTEICRTSYEIHFND
jgi:hypothetical protein